VSGFEWEPDSFLATMLAEIPGYEELQETVADEARGRNVLELGTGTGETAVRILTRNAGARWTGIDASEAMLERARERLPHADLRLQRLEDPLPEGPFDLVVSVLAVHHLDGPAKRDLFRRVAEVGDFFVLGDLVVAERAEDAVIEIDWVMDLPSTMTEQIEWLEEAGFDVDASYVRPDLAVFVAVKSGDLVATQSQRTLYPPSLKGLRNARHRSIPPSFDGTESSG
jgi:tRNA (cmo5U34)-methyltransferase